MTKDEALKLALEALHGFIPYLPLNDEAQCGRYDKAITAIKEALANEALDKKAENARELGLDYEPAQQEYERGFIDGMQEQMRRSVDRAVNAMAQRTWVGLTEGEVDKMILLMGFPPDWITENAIVKNIVRNLEAKLKEKNT